MRTEAAPRPAWCSRRRPSAVSPGLGGAVTPQFGSISPEKRDDGLFHGTDATSITQISAHYCPSPATPTPSASLQICAYFRRKDADTSCSRSFPSVGDSFTCCNRSVTRVGGTPVACNRSSVSIFGTITVANQSPIRVRATPAAIFRSITSIFYAVTAIGGRPAAVFRSAVSIFHAVAAIGGRLVVVHRPSDRSRLLLVLLCAQSDPPFPRRHSPSPHPPARVVRRPPSCPSATGQLEYVAWRRPDAGCLTRRITAAGAMTTDCTTCQMHLTGIA